MYEIDNLVGMKITVEHLLNIEHELM